MENALTENHSQNPQTSTCYCRARNEVTADSLSGIQLCYQFKTIQMEGFGGNTL